MSEKMCLKLRKNITLQADGEDGIITWNAPAEGYHGGYFTGDNITYTVVRFPDEVEVATNITEEKLHG